MQKFLKSVMIAAILAGPFAVAATLPARALVEIDIYKGYIVSLVI